MSKAITTLKIKGVSCPVEDAATKAELTETNTLLNTTKQSFEQFKEDTSSSLESIESGDAIVNKAYNDENGHNLADTLELATETKTAFEAFKTSTESALDTKLTKVTRTHSVAGLIYGVMNDGSQTIFSLTTPANEYTVPYRLSDGTINVGTPTADTNATTKKYVDDKLTRTALIEVIGKATSSLDGVMSKEDKGHLDTLVALMKDDDNTVVDKIHEIIAIFNQYPEGTEIATTLSNLNTKIKNVEDNKVDTSTYNTKVGELETRVGSLESDITTKANSSAIPTKVSQLENDSSYVTSSTLSGYNYATKTDLNSYVTTAIYNNEVSRLEDDIAGLQDEVGTKANTSTLNDYAKKTDLNSKANSADVYTKTESDNTFQPKGNYLTEVPNTYATTSYVDTKTSDLISKTVADSSYQPKGDYLTSIPDTYATKKYVDDATTDLITQTKADEIYQPAGDYATVSDLNNFTYKVASGKGIGVLESTIDGKKKYTISNTKKTLGIVNSEPPQSSTNYDARDLYLFDDVIYYVGKRNASSISYLGKYTNLPIPVDGLSVCKYTDDKVFLFGGRFLNEETNTYEYNKKIFEYNLNTGEVWSIGIAPFESENGEAIIINGMIYIFTANNGSNYDTVNNQIWRFDPDSYAMDLVYEAGRGVDFGCKMKFYNISLASDDHYIYVFRKNAFARYEPDGDFNIIRGDLLYDYSGGMAVNFNGSIYAFGISEETGKTVYAKVTPANSSINEYTTNLPSLNFYTGCVINNLVYFFGGSNVVDDRLNDKMYIFNLVTGSVSNETSPIVLEDVRGVLQYTEDRRNLFFIFGGSNTDAAVNTVNVFGNALNYETNSLATHNELNSLEEKVKTYCVSLDIQVSSSEWDATSGTFNGTLTYLTTTPSSTKDIVTHLNIMRKSKFNPQIFSTSKTDVSMGRYPSSGEYFVRLKYAEKGIFRAVTEAEFCSYIIVTGVTITAI